VAGGKGEGRREDAISYDRSQCSVGTCNNVLPVFVVSATSLALLSRPNLLYQIFFLWGFLKDRVFRRRIVTLQDLKQAIVDEDAAINEDLRRRVYGNLQTRLQQCIDIKGGHLPDVQKISL